MLCKAILLSVYLAQPYLQLVLFVKYVSLQFTVFSCIIVLNLDISIKEREREKEIIYSSYLIIFHRSSFLSNLTFIKLSL